MSNMQEPMFCLLKHNQTNKKNYFAHIKKNLLIETKIYFKNILKMCIAILITILNLLSFSFNRQLFLIITDKPSIHLLIYFCTVLETLQTDHLHSDRHLEK